MSLGLFTVLLVDRTGTFRAPIAASLLRHELDKEGHEDVTVLAGGTETKKGHSISPHVAELIPSLMANSTGPTANEIARDLANEAHLILVMDESQHEWLLERTPEIADRIRLLGRFAQGRRCPQIPAVEGEKQADLQRTFHNIERAILGLISEWDLVRNRFFVRQKFDVAVGADHRGFATKKEIIDYLDKDGFRALDCGTDSAQSSDHPVYAIRVGEMVARQEVDRGILICGSGLGMSISANKVHAVRAAMCINPDHAALSRSHNNANVLCLAADCFPEEEEIEIVRVWMKTPFLGGKYQRRINILSHYEKGNRNGLPSEEKPGR
ncbi:MAG: ribose 5-phosphate isomerase B [bacterium]